MVIEKPQLFPERRDFLLFVVLMLLLLAVRLFFLHTAYQAFIAKPFYFTTAKVLNTYPKHRGGKHYTVLKVRNDEGLTFFTSSYRKEDLRNRVLRLQIYPNQRISFWEYLGTFYLKSRIKAVEEPLQDLRSIGLQKVAAQHTDANLSAFYQAIFFAAPLPSKLRERIAALGVSHLVALSGFHLGILWSLVYGILLLLYRPLQARFFPYRFSLLDIGLVTIIALGIYVWFTGFPPSLVRSYAMLLVGWVVILLGMELLSFTFLATVGLTLLVLFPSLLVSLGFWLSIGGVFYIFLLLQYTQGLSKWSVSLLVIPLGIFILMLPIVHLVFGLTTPYQLLSPLLSVLFIPFYPLAMLLHLIGIGSLMDDALLYLFDLPREVEDSILPLWLFAGYVGFSVWAIWSKAAFYFLIASALTYSVYLFW